MSEIESNDEEQLESVEYRDIPGFPGYQVGSDGSVWSSVPLGPAAGPARWRRLKPSVTHRRRRSPYLLVRLNVGERRKQKQRLVHRIVLEAFIGPCPPGMQCCHEDGDGLNDNLDNLRWDTPKANAADKARHETQAQGGAVWSARFSEQDVKLILFLGRQGFPRKRIAGLFDAHTTVISKILDRQLWKHVREDITGQPT